MRLGWVQETFSPVKIAIQIKEKSISLKPGGTAFSESLNIDIEEILKIEISSNASNICLNSFSNLGFFSTVFFFAFSHVGFLELKWNMLSKSLIFHSPIISDRWKLL